MKILTTRQFRFELMKFSLTQGLFMLLIMGVSHAHHTNAQMYLNKRLSIEADRSQIKKVLTKIEKATEVHFVYSSQVIEPDMRVSLVENNSTLSQVLEKLLTPLNIKYELAGRKVILSTSISHTGLTEGNQEENQINVKDLMRTATGIVTDEKGAPLVGVNVILKGSQKGSTTDADGKFSIEILGDESVLVFSFVGYKNQEVVIGSKPHLIVNLTPEDKSLAEVVVIGYGTQKQREVTGSIATLQAGHLEDQPVGQFAQKLQGRIAGVQINQTTGVPGGGINIRIRGAASINAGNSPLYVVDGFPIVGGINNINPNEIETFSVLKGASAAALYGSRAANGVVLITTKQAKPGKTSIQFSATYGIARVPQRGRAKLMSAKEFLQDRKEIFEDKIKYEGYQGGIPELYQNPESWTGPDTDWYEELLQPAGQNSYNLSLLSNKDNFSTATTLGYYKEKGSIINTDFQRFSLRSNNMYKVNKAIKVGVNIAPTYQTSNNPETENFYSIIYAAIITPPIFSPDEKNPDGTRKVSFTGPGLFTFPNWKRSVEETINVTNSTRLLSSAYAQIDFLKDFRFKSSVSIDIMGSKQRIFSPSTVGTIFSNAPKLATGSYQTTQYTSWLTENTLNYNKTISQNHNLEVLLGYSAQLFRQENNLLTGTSFPDDAVSWIDAAAIRSGNSNSTEWSLLSMYSRLNYNFKGKYLLAASIRRDGSSRFGSENRWGSFPSISAGWIISDEAFAQNWRSLSYLKLRTEFGDAGNFNIGNYSQFGNINSTNYMFGGGLVQGRSPSSIGNNKLTWETTRGMDVGIDFGLFGDRISVTLDYYRKNTKNMLYQVDIPSGAGFTNIQDNIGEFHFWGYEAGVSTKNLVGDLKWTSDFNVSINRNKVIKRMRPIEPYFNRWM
jgi:TonB-linked SusC/RagA family outer membrane protein